MATPYTAVLVWASDEGKNGYFREKGDVKSGLVKGVMSCWKQDIENYDNEDYRDAGTSEILAESATVDYLTLIEDPETPTEKSLTLSNAGTAPDESLHIPPRAQKHKRSLLTFWDDALGEGNMLYHCWADQHISFEVSEETYSYI